MDQDKPLIGELIPYNPEPPAGVTDMKPYNPNEPQNVRPYNPQGSRKQNDDHIQQILDSFTEPTTEWAWVDNAQLFSEILGYDPGYAYKHNEITTNAPLLNVLPSAISKPRGNIPSPYA